MAVMMPERLTSPTAPSVDWSADELLEQLAQGDVQALDGLYELVADDLYGLALWRCGSEAEAADAVQETFVKLAQVAGRGKLASQLRGVRDARAYLLTMVRRAAVDQLRKRRGHASLDEPTSEARLLEAASIDPASKVELERACERLAEVPPKQREVVYLRCFEDLSFEQIGQVCQIPTFTAASRFRLGLQKLRTLLGVSR